MANYEQPAKKFRSDYDPPSRGSKDSYGDNQKVSPSPVVHVRGINENVTRNDLAEAVSQFGQVNYVMMIAKKRQALVEFDDVSCAANCVHASQERTIYIQGTPAYFNFSTSQKIQRPPGADIREDNKGGPRGNMGPSRGMGPSRDIGPPRDMGYPSRDFGNRESQLGPNRILAFTVLNPQYPITVDVMQTICSQHGGEVLRIIVYKKNGVQAMVEFDSFETAQRAKEALQGADIYSGCCTLKIEFSNLSTLTVYKNDSETWDYTKPDLGKEISRGRPLLADPPYGGGQFGNEAPARGRPNSYSGDGFGEYGSSTGNVYGGPPRDRFAPPGGPFGGPPRGMYGAGGDGYPQGEGGGPSVLMVYNMAADKMNSQRLFNLFCLYGNVERVKFLRSKEGSAMVQMNSFESAERVIKNLNQITFFNSKIQITPSKQTYLQEVQNIGELPDGSPAYVDFTSSRNNRFSTPEAAAKNRITEPCVALHYFNVPPDMSEESFRKIFEEVGAKEPTKIMAFPAKSERSSTGLIEWVELSDAVEALILANHYTVPNPKGKNPYVLKLCFSQGPIKEKNERNDPRSQH